jgi:hypothetical protein
LFFLISFELPPVGALDAHQLNEGWGRLQSGLDVSEIGFLRRRPGCRWMVTA